jgi:hypothetical protein
LRDAAAGPGDAVGSTDANGTVGLAGVLRKSRSNSVPILGTAAFQTVYSAVLESRLGHTGWDGTALIVGVPAADPLVSVHRPRFDVTGGWEVPAHVTVFYPFGPPPR